MPLRTLWPGCLVRVISLVTYFLSWHCAHRPQPPVRSEGLNPEELCRGGLSALTGHHGSGAGLLQLLSDEEGETASLVSTGREV